MTGGILKRAADRAVDFSHADNDVDDFLKVTGETKVMLFRISTGDIAGMQRRIPFCVRPITGTMKLHQLQLIERSHMSARNYSCFCLKLSACDCFNAQCVSLPDLLGVLPSQRCQYNRILYRFVLCSFSMYSDIDIFIVGILVLATYYCSTTI